MVVAIDNPPDEIRPGLSCTGKIVTATRAHALTIPIQALTVRQRGDLEPANKNKGVEAATKPEVNGILTFYMGKNTPERKDYIMENLVVPVED